MLYTNECHAYRRAIDELAAALDEARLPVRFALCRIDGKTDAKKRKFSGSPTIQLDGEDIDLEARAVKNFAVAACRPYQWEGKSYDWPPKAMIVAALLKKYGKKT